VAGRTVGGDAMTKFCDAKCRFCEWNAERGYWQLRLAVWPIRASSALPEEIAEVHPATRIIACPNCGRKLNPGGTVTERVDKAVALRLAGLLRNAEDECPPQWKLCDLADGRQCDECVLAWAEQQAEQEADDATP
jgi:hypothetical protein